MSRSGIGGRGSGVGDVAERPLREQGSGVGGWGLAAVFAVGAVLVVIGLFYYWFAVADRYVVFLYHHDMPPLFPDTAPFSRITSSRYWMASLVASGLVMVLYTAVNFIWGRLDEGYRAPSWWQVWALSAFPLAVAVPLVTMKANRPVLPFSNALVVTLVTLLGSGLAYQPGKAAARAPAELALLAVDGFGLMLIALLIGQIERLLELSARGLPGFLLVSALGLAAGLFLLLFATAIRSWRGMAIPGSWSVLTAGWCVAYPLMALIHHLYVGLTGGYFYISDADNFFARRLWPSFVAWLLAAGIAFALTKLRRSRAESDHRRRSAQGGRW